MSEDCTEADAVAESAKRLSFGTYVRHARTGRVGIVIRINGCGLIDVAWATGGLSLLKDPRKLAVMTMKGGGRDS